MSDGTMTADQIEPETPAIEEAAEDTELQSEQEQPGEETGEEPEQDAEEFEEFEHDGKRYAIPKAVKPLLMMQSDYTRKTQEVAEQRRAVQSEREAVVKAAEAHMQHIAEVGKLHVLDDALKTYQGVDWNTLRASNPEQTQAAFMEYMSLKDQRDQLDAKIRKDIESRAQEQQQDVAKRAAETHSVMEKEVPGWNQETANKVRDFALGKGVSRDHLVEIATNPSLAKLLHLAWLGEQLVTKQAAAAKAAKARVPPPEAEVKPLKIVGRKPSGAAKPGLHDNLSIDEWMRRANGRAQA